MDDPLAAFILFCFFAEFINLTHSFPGFQGVEKGCVGIKLVKRFSLDP